MPARNCFCFVHLVYACVPLTNEFGHAKTIHDRASFLLSNMVVLAKPQHYFYKYTHNLLLMPEPSVKSATMASIRQTHNKC